MLLSSVFQYLWLFVALATASTFNVPKHDREDALQTKPCTKSTMAVRREWSALSPLERRSYTDAVQCLRDSPSHFEPGLVPGALSRYDDFVAVHINMTLIVHISGYFLSWHRYYVHLYEKALQEECGYNGTQPYWNWPLYASDLRNSTLFDGSPYSMGSDGTTVVNASDIAVGANVTLPHGTGGGCVYSGPFADSSVNMGPFDFSLVFAGILPSNWSDYTPHCLSRDLNTYIAERYTNQTAVEQLIYNTSTIADFQDTMSGPVGTDVLGVHGGGHFTMGSSGRDFFASPGDPAFFLHHGMIDRVWTLWQNLEPETRLFALSGTRTCLDNPPSGNVTLEDIETWGGGVLGGNDLKVQELMSVRDGPFCYRYE